MYAGIVPNGRVLTSEGVEMYIPNALTTKTAKCLK